MLDVALTQSSWLVTSHYYTFHTCLQWHAKYDNKAWRLQEPDLVSDCSGPSSTRVTSMATGSYNVAMFISFSKHQRCGRHWGIKYQNTVTRSPTEWKPNTHVRGSFGKVSTNNSSALLHRRQCHANGEAGMFSECRMKRCLSANKVDWSSMKNLADVFNRTHCI